MFALPESAIRPFLAPHIGRDANFVLMYAGLPLSRGTIKLASSDPLQAPLIDPNYFSHPADMAALVEGYKKTVGLYEGTKAWQKLGATLSPTHYPPCANFSLRGDEYIECFIRHWTTTMWHPTSTAKMGAADDPMAVLDSNLRYRPSQKPLFTILQCVQNHFLSFVQGEWSKRPSCCGLFRNATRSQHEYECACNDDRREGICPHPRPMAKCQNRTLSKIQHTLLLPSQ
jgi:hypothetical protein